MLSPGYQPYYELLLKAIASHQDAGLSEMRVVEACFKSGLEHWRMAYRQAVQRGFGSVVEEVHFFKEVKPAFGARIEYYTYRYHALLFAPVGDAQEIQRFWRWEQRKMEKFFESNREFCRYMREGDTVQDETYFRRVDRPLSGGRSVAGPMFDPDGEMISPMDHLVTTLRAYELYEKHIHVIINQHCPLEAIHQNICRQKG